MGDVIVSENESILVMLARMEGKIDAAISGLDGRMNAVISDHRITKDTVADHEARLRVQESRAMISPKQLWVSLLAAVGGVVSLLNIFDWVRGF